MVEIDPVVAVLLVIVGFLLGLIAGQHEVLHKLQLVGMRAEFERRMKARTGRPF